MCEIIKKSLLCFDLDETLLRSDKSISEYTISVLKRWKQNGGKIAFATARSIFKVIEYTNLVEIDALVSLSGAFVYVGQKKIDSHPIDKNIVEKLRLLCINYPDTYMSVFSEDKIFTNYKPFLSHGDCIYDDYSNPIDYEIGKILFLNNEIVNSELLDIISKTKYKADAHETSYSIYNEAANKFNGIKKMCEQMDVNIENVISFGNDDNDMDMIIHSGIGVAVGNSTENLKLASDYICLDNDSDGPAKWVEKYMNDTIVNSN